MLQVTVGGSSSVVARGGHAIQRFDISEQVVDYDAQIAADLEQDIMNPAPQLRNFVWYQAQQQQRMTDLQKHIDGQPNELRSAAANRGATAAAF